MAGFCQQDWPGNGSANSNEKDVHYTMRTAREGTNRGTSVAAHRPEDHNSAVLLKKIIGWLEDAKAEDIVIIDLDGKSSIGDYMLVASGRSDRHVGAIADQIQRKLKEHGHGSAKVEGKEACDWVLIDNGDIIIHVFRPEVREFYNLEKMWAAERPADETAH